MKKYTLLILLFFGQYAIYAQKIALDTIWVKRYGWAYKDGMTGTDLMLQFVYPNGTDSIAQHIREDITKKFLRPIQYHHWMNHVRYYWRTPLEICGLDCELKLICIDTPP